MDCQVPDLGLAGEILNGGRIDQSELQARAAHAGIEEEEQGTEDQDQDPMHVNEILFSSPLGEEVSHVDQRTEAIDRTPARELDEELERGL